MRNITRTGYGAQLQTALFLGLNHDIPAYSGVADYVGKPDIFPQPAPTTLGMEVFEPYSAAQDTRDLKMTCYCIGNGAHQNVSGPGPDVTLTRPHRATDAGPFNMIPFAMKQIWPVNNDFTALERANYRIRKTLMKDGILYAAYFAKPLNLTGVTPDLMYATSVDGNTVAVPFVPTSTDLWPAPTTPGAVSGGTTISVTAASQILFTPADVVLLREACEILYGTADYAIISEIGFLTGKDKEVTAAYPTSGTQTAAAVPADTYFELCGAQIAAHYSTYRSVVYDNLGFTISYDLGTGEALYGAQLS